MELPWKPDSLENALTLATLFEVTTVFLKGIFYSHGDSQAVPGTILVPGLRPPVIPGPVLGAIPMVRVSLSRAEVAAAEERGLRSPGLCVDFLWNVCLHGPHRKHPRTI